MSMLTENLFYYTFSLLFMKLRYKSDVKDFAFMFENNTLQQIIKRLWSPLNSYIKTIWLRIDNLVYQISYVNKNFKNHSYLPVSTALGYIWVWTSCQDFDKCSSLQAHVIDYSRRSGN